MNYKENFHWINKGKVLIEGNRITMTAPALTDSGAHAAVSVVTKNGESDDANGCNIEGQNHLWLKVCRVGRAFSSHYSLDGEKFYMTRYFLMPESKAVKVGLLAQAPTGNGGDRIYEHLSIEQITVKNIRLGE